MHAPERRHQLLEAALEVFSRKGFEGTTTKEIAAAAGVTEAVIFKHFPTKQALYTAVLDHYVQASELTDWLSAIQSHIKQNDDAGLLRAIAAAILKSYREDARYERVLLFAALEGHESGLAHHRQISLPISELLREYLLRRQKEGALRNYDPGLILAAVAGMAKHYAMLTGMFGFDAGGKRDEQVIDTFTCIVLNGIRPSPGEQEAHA